MIYYITPYLKDNIGKGLNDHIALLPDDAWICIRDQDTLMFEDGAQLIEQIINETDFSLIGCITNRLRDNRQLHEKKFSYEESITEHQKIAHQRFCSFRSIVTPVKFDLAGVFMLFPKEIWSKVGGFAEKSILFDRDFTNKVKRIGKVGIAQGLYIFHLYRWGQKDPVNYIKHLKTCK